MFQFNQFSSCRVSFKPLKTLFITLTRFPFDLTRCFYKNNVLKLDYYGEKKNEFDLAVLCVAKIGFKGPESQKSGLKLLRRRIF